MKPVCLRCHVSMKLARAGVFLELMTAPTTTYEIWSSDVFQCPSCGIEIATQFGAAPIARHFEGDLYAKWAKRSERFWDRVDHVPDELRRAPQDEWRVAYEYLYPGLGWREGADFCQTDSAIEETVSRLTVQYRNPRKQRREAAGEWKDVEVKT